MKAFRNLIFLMALATTVAKADIVINFDLPNQTGAPGGTLQFFGVISNNGVDTVFLNSDSLTLAGSSFNITDQFFNTVPISLDGGQSSGDIELFDVTLSNPLLDPYGTYDGSYTLIGGIDGNAQDNLAMADFSVTAAPPPPGVPEPPPLALAGTGLLALLGTRHLKPRNRHLHSHGE